MTKRARRGLGRREFLAGALALPAARVPRLVRKSDELGVAVVGVNGRGAEHVEALRQLPGVRLVAVCDVDDHVAAREARRLRERAGVAVDLHSDLRYVLDRADVDALVIATPDHWHALQTIWACQAGKDVFLEMPATHLYGEGAPLAAAAAKFGRIIQCNLPARASTAVREAVEWVRAHNLGEIELVRGLHYVAEPPLATVSGNQRLPEFIDYDLWCGPSPLLPLRRAKLHRDWRWFFAHGEGALADAAGVLDLARWVLGAEGLPESVVSLGTRAAGKDAGETPDTQLLFYTYPSAPLVFEVRGMPRDAEARKGDWAAGMDELLGVRSGVVVHAAGGTLRIPNATSAIAFDADGKEVRRFEGAVVEGAVSGLGAWVEACKQRSSESLGAGVEVGVRSSALVHLGQASHRVGRATARDAVLTALSSSAVLRSAAGRMIAHLDANAVDPEAHRLVLGPCLFVDHEHGCFREDAGANTLLAGSHRAPYVLPTG